MRQAGRIPMTITEVRGLHPGSKVVMLTDNVGCDPQDVERTHPAGSTGRVTSLRLLPEPQGLAVTITIGEDEDTAICATFDENDDCGYAFRPFGSTADQSGSGRGLDVEPRMRSAGAELMSLSMRLARTEGFEADAARLNEIGAWITVERPSDIQRATFEILGSLIAACRRRGMTFAEDRPISTQMTELLDRIPYPIAGEEGYVDQSTLPPLERRDVFEAVVEMQEIRNWTAGDGVPRALCHDADITPTGVAGRALIQAEGENASLLVAGRPIRLRLRPAGGCLLVEGPGAMQDASR